MKKGHLKLAIEVGTEINALLVASRTVIAASAQMFHPSVQIAAYQLAVMLSSRGPTKPRELAALLDMDKSAISRLGKSLCDHGLAQMSVDPNDGRGAIYFLTELGQKRVEDASSVKLDAFFKRLHGWSGDDLREFGRLLRSFNGHPLD